MALSFGTDGIRGVANAELSVEVVLGLGHAAARHLGARGFLIGRDTRQSSPMLAAALAAGLAAEGAHVLDLGVITTPGLAHLAAARSMPGAMISASHNPYPDNGIKLVSSQGTKLDDPTELAIEAELLAIMSGDGASLGPVGASVGTIIEDLDGARSYGAHLISLSGPIAGGLKVVCDCANGAASAIAPVVLAGVGLAPVVIHASPNGTNINEGCGSMHPEGLIAAVLEHRADVGLGFDGDADRLIAVDETGQVVDGDVLMALFAFDLLEHGELSDNAIAITVMSNLGLRKALAARGIAVIETPVGDRYVVDAIKANGLSLGGEQSGHIVFGNLASTGDGILSGLKLLELLARKAQPLSALSAGAMTRLPQELVSVRVGDRAKLDEAARVWEAVAVIERALGDSGRVLVRASGTEELIRVMIEASDHEVARAGIEQLTKLLEEELGAPER